MTIFDFKNYKKFVNNHLKGLPNGGYGQLSRIAERLGVNSTYISQVFRGPKSLNMDQALLLAEFMGLTALETKYFLKLVEIDRAGSQKLKSYLEGELNTLFVKSQKVSERLNKTSQLPDEEKAQFYSQWHYSAIRLMTDNESYQDTKSLAERFDLDLATVNQVVEFLLNNGLLEKKQNRLVAGPSRTHLDAKSPYIKTHHTNWRLKALDKVGSQPNKNLHYSAPMILSAADAKKVKSELLQVIQKVGSIVDPSPSEDLMCMNIDWFEI